MQNPDPIAQAHAIKPGCASWVKAVSESDEDLERFDRVELPRILSIPGLFVDGKPHTVRRPHGTFIHAVLVRRESE